MSRLDLLIQLMLTHSYLSAICYFRWSYSFH